MGVDGLVMSYTNIDPTGVLELIRAIRDGNRELADTIQRKFIDVWTSYPPDVSFIAGLP